MFIHTHTTFLKSNYQDFFGERRLVFEVERYDQKVYSSELLEKIRKQLDNLKLNVNNTNEAKSEIIKAVLNADKSFKNNKKTIELAQQALNLGKEKEEKILEDNTVGPKTIEAVNNLNLKGVEKITNINNIDIISKYSNYAPFLNLIFKYESKSTGGFNAARGPYKGEKITNLTVEKIMRLQKEGKLYAVGGYQMIRNTLKEAVQYLKINPNTEFTADLQNKIAVDYILKVKRPAIGKYLNGKGSLETAAQAAYLEWSVFQMESGKGRYDGTYGNNAKVLYQTLLDTLKQTRKNIG